MKTQSFRVALAVFKEEIRLGGKRGANRAAIAAAAAEFDLPFETVKKYSQRHPFWRDEMRAAKAGLQWLQELDGRMLGFPDDVREKLMNHAAGRPLLDYLREHKIDGTCPAWFIELVRAHE